MVYRKKKKFMKIKSSRKTHRLKIKCFKGKFDDNHLVYYLFNQITYFSIYSFDNIYFSCIYHFHFKKSISVLKSSKSSWSILVSKFIFNFLVFFSTDYCLFIEFAQWNSNIELTLNHYRLRLLNLNHQYPDLQLFVCLFSYAYYLS